VELGRALDCKGDIAGAAREYGEAYQLNHEHPQAGRYFAAALVELNASSPDALMLAGGELVLRILSGPATHGDWARLSVDPVAVVSSEPPGEPDGV